MDGSWLTQWTIQVSTGPPTRLLCFVDPRVEYSVSQAPQGDEIAWWIAQMILSVPIPALLVYELVVLLLGALPQTLIDGSSASTGKHRCCNRSLQFLLILTQFTEASRS